MTDLIDSEGPPHPPDLFCKHLLRLQLPHIRMNYDELAQTAAEHDWGHRLSAASGHSVLFTTAIDIIHTLSAATAVGAGALKRAMQRYLKPRLLICDELGYLPIDKLGADLLFQIISERYERGSILMSTNRAFKHWPEIFNNDSVLTSALLDRLLHHADVSLIEGKSFRAKDQIET
jgi:DNA replication protein DnaC